MPYRKLMQDSLDYIEENLCADLKAAELAKRAGFSVYHFYRLFHQTTGMPVMQYIQRRRMLHAVYAVRCGQPRIEAALNYGFDTYAGFYKAFRREFHCTPSAFIQKKRAQRPAPIDLMKEKQMKLTHEEARKILCFWGWENETVRDLYYESSGHAAECAVCVGEHYVLKKTTSAENIQKVHQLSKALEDMGVDTQTPVPTVDGRGHIEQNGMIYCLYRQPEAAAVTAVSLYGAGGAARARYVGELIGQLHLTLENAAVDAKESDLLETVRNWALPKAASILHLSPLFCQEYLAALTKLYPQLPRQIIHRDPNPSSILMGKERWGVVDLERAERNVRIFDPCYAATAVLSESFEAGDEEKMQEWLAIYHQVLLGYDSVIPLTETERMAAPYVLLANQLICTAWFSEQPQYTELYETNRRMTQWLIGHFEQLL